MAIYNELEPVFRKPMVVFFVVDPTLARYWENQAESFQNTLNRTVPVLRMTFQNSVDSSCSVAVLVAGENPVWQTPDGPVPCEEFTWQEIPCGPSDLNQSLAELHEKMNYKTFLHSDVGMWRPVVFFLLSGDCPEQPVPALERLRKNNWFLHAARIVLQLGGEANHPAAEQLTDEPDTVVRVQTPEQLGRWLEALVPFVSVNENMGCGPHQTGSASALKRPNEKGILMIALAKEILDGTCADDGDYEAWQDEDNSERGDEYEK